MRWQLEWRQLLVVAAIFAAGLFWGSRGRTSDAMLEGSAAERLRPAAMPLAETSTGGTVYVPVYSSIYLGLDIKKNTVELAATVSVRNVSTRHPIVLEVVRYYDSAGKPVRDYIDHPSELAPMATVEFVIQRADSTGGPGANFLIQWKGPTDVDAPMVEAVMVGHSGNAGISFTSLGRAVKPDTSTQGR